MSTGPHTDVGHIVGTDDLVDHGEIAAALDLARRAPSVHNSQPWWWRIGDGVVQIWADLERWLPATDPDGRDLLLGCGAALHHLRVALAARGHSTVVRRLPDEDVPDLLAVVGVRPGPTTDTAVDPTLAPAILRRRSDHRPFRRLPLPAADLAALTAAAVSQGVHLHIVDDDAQAGVVELAQRTAAAEHTSVGYATELHSWIDGDGDGDGPTGTAGPGTVRGWQGPTIDGAVLVLLATSSDDRLSRLRAGEAASAVLLAATTLGLATCPLSEPLETDVARGLVEAEVLRGAMCPQLFVRIGEPTFEPTAGRAASTPRRALADQVELLGPDE